MYSSLRHVGGITVPIKPPLPLTYVIEGNDSEAGAKHVSPTEVAEVPALKYFEKSGKLQALPKPLEDKRIGMCSPESSAPAESETLAIEDREENDDEANAGVTPPPVLLLASDPATPPQSVRTRKQTPSRPSVPKSKGPPKR